MYTFKTFFVLILASYVIAAPPTDEPAECRPLKEKEGELSKCCKTEAISVKEEAAAKECFKLVKDKDDKKGPPKPEGYDGTDKKIDAAKVNAAAKATYTGDWAEPGAKMVEKCLTQAAACKDCSSEAESYMKCIFRESYINCPEKLWTNSDACKTNKERLNKCPKALPYIGKMD